MADGNGFIKVNDKLPEDGSIIDKDTICVCSGTFRASSAMDGRNVLHPIPLASSNGCSTTTTNFKLVVQGMMKKDGTLELEFSDNFGQSYYTNEKRMSQIIHWTKITRRYCRPRPCPCPFSRRWWPSIQRRCFDLVYAFGFLVFFVCNSGVNRCYLSQTIPF